METAEALHTFLGAFFQPNGKILVELDQIGPSPQEGWTYIEMCLKASPI